MVTCYLDSPDRCSTDGRTVNTLSVDKQPLATVTVRVRIRVRVKVMARVKVRVRM